MAGYIGDADIVIGADASKFGQALDTATRSITRTVTGNLNKIASATPKQLSGMVKSVGSSMQAVGSKLTNFITKPVLGAAAAAGGLATVLGFKRLVGIDTARGQFKGLGLDADAVMKQVDKGVTNTSLSMAEGAAAAVGILATGSLPLKDLEGQIKRVANVSAAYGVEASQASYLLNNVLTKNKVTYGDLSQMVKNQIPIISELANHYGVTGDEIEAMANRGEISIEDFNKVLDNVAGKAALEYAQTWSGVTKNIMSNIGKVSAKLMEPTFEIIKAKAMDFLELLQSPEFSNWAEEMGQKIGNFVEKVIGGISAMISWWNQLSPTMQKVLTGFGVAAVAAGPFLSIIGKITSGVGSLIGTFAPLGAAVSGMAGNLVRGLTGASGASFTFAGRLGLAITESGGLLKVLGRFAGIAGLVVTAFIAMWQNSESFREGISQLFEAVKSLVSGAFDVLMSIMKALKPLFESSGGVIGKLAGILGDVLGGALKIVAPILEVLAEIIGAVLIFAIEKLGQLIEWLADLIGPYLGAALDGVGAALEWLGELFAGTGDKAGLFADIAEWVKGAWEAVSSWFTGTFLPAIESVWDGVMSAVQPVIDWFSEHVGPVFEALGELFSAVFEGIGETAQTNALFLQEVWSGVTDFFGTIWDGIQAHWEAIGRPVFEAIGEVWGVVWDGIMAVWEAVGPPLIEGIGAAWEGVKTVFQTVWEVISEIFTTVWEVIKTTVETVLTIIAEIINIITAGIKGDWEGVWLGIQNIATTIMESTRSVLSSIFNGIKNVITTIMNGVASFWTSTWTAIKAFGTAIWEGIKAVVTGAVNVLRSVITSVVNGIKSTWTNAWNAVKTLFTNVWRAIVSSASGFASSVRSTFNSVVSFVSSIPGRVMGFFSGMGGMLVSSGRALIDGFKNGIMSAFDAVVGAVQGGLSKIRGLFPFSPAKDGPFSGRGWVKYSGQSLGKTFGDSTADALSSSRRGIENEVKNISDIFSSAGAQGVQIEASLNLGEEFARQFAAGMLQGEDKVAQAAESLATAILGPLGSIVASPSINGSLSRVGSGGTLLAAPRPAAPRAAQAANTGLRDGDPVRAVFLDVDGVLAGTIDGKISTALEPIRPSDLRATLGLA